MEKHLEAKGVMAAHELQALFSVVRANDLIWSSVVSHYLLDKEAPPSDILHWFADGAHIPKAFLLDWASRILVDNELTDARRARLSTRRAMVISLKDDHVSAWQATYDGAKLLGRRDPLPARRLGPQCRRDQPARAPTSTATGPTTKMPDDARSNGSKPPPATKAAGGPNGRPGWSATAARR